MYGSSITLERAKQLAAPAIAEARKNQWTMAVAIVDISGALVYFEKMDDTQNGSVDVAIAKARSAARFREMFEAAAKKWLVREDRDRRGVALIARGNFARIKPSGAQLAP